MHTESSSLPPSLDPAKASTLAAFYDILGNDTRLRLLYALMQTNELCVTDLATRLAMTPQAVSNQLQRLVDRRILAARRDGNHIYYHLVDPRVRALLRVGVRLLREAPP